jgi:hypothetical protein
MDGGRFVIFVARDAGIGRRVATLQSANLESTTGVMLVTSQHGSEFTDEHPRLHYGWKTTKEYHSRFGYLDYMCRWGPDELYSRDAGPVTGMGRSPLRLPVVSICLLGVRRRH